MGAWLSVVTLALFPITFAMSGSTREPYCALNLVVKTEQLGAVAGAAFSLAPLLVQAAQFRHLEYTELHLYISMLVGATFMDVVPVIPFYLDISTTLTTRELGVFCLRCLSIILLCCTLLFHGTRLDTRKLLAVRVLVLLLQAGLSDPFETRWLAAALAKIPW